MPPINGEIFLKKMDQFLTRTDLYTKSTERLISRMEDFFMQEKDKDKKEKKLKQKEVYVKTKDPLMSIDARIGKSNVLLEDILKSIKRNGGSVGGLLTGKYKSTTLAAEPDIDAISNGNALLKQVLMGMYDSEAQFDEYGNAKEGPMTKSGARARGPLQMMPKTQLGLESRTGKIYDLTTNKGPTGAIGASADLIIETQKRYMKLGNLTENEAMELAVVDYFGGPNNVAAWLQGKMTSDATGSYKGTLTTDYLSRTMGQYSLFGVAPSGNVRDLKGLRQNSVANMPNPIEVDNGIFQVLKDGVQTTITQDSMEQLADTMAQAWRDTIESENRKFMGQDSGMSSIGNIR